MSAVPSQIIPPPSVLEQLMKQEDIQMACAFFKKVGGVSRIICDPKLVRHFKKELETHKATQAMKYSIPPRSFSFTDAEIETTLNHLKCMLLDQKKSIEELL